MKVQVLITFYLFLCADCFGQTVMAWKTERGIGFEHASTTTHALLQTGILSRGGGMGYIDNSTYSYVGLFPVNNPTMADAIASNAYYQIILQAKPGAILSLNTLTARLRRGLASSPNMYRWRYSINGGDDFYDLGPGHVTMTATAADDTNGEVQVPIDLSGVCDLQNVPSSTEIIFRLYAWGRTGTTNNSNFGFGKSFFSDTANNPIEFTGVVEMPLASAPILSWQPPTATEHVVLPTTMSDANIEKGELNRGPGLGFSSSSTYTYTSNFPINASKAAAVTANAYYEVTMKAKSGYYLNLNGLTSRLRRNVAAAPNTYRWSYSLNGTNFTEVGPGDVTMSMIAGDDTNGEDQYLIDLSGIAALKNVPSSVQVTFRLYIWGGTATNSNIGFGKSYVAGTTNTDYNALAFYGSVKNTLTALPVKLTSFNGKVEENTVKLNWTTASEKNNAGFEIFRSSTGKPDEMIGIVNGKGTSEDITNYNFTDYSPFTGINYYQLRQVDYDGKSELSEIISLKIGLERSDLNVIASDAGIIVYTKGIAEGKAKFYVYDIAGRLLADKQVVLDSNNNVFNISMNCSSGIYVASLVASDGRRLSTRFYK